MLPQALIHCHLQSCLRGNCSLSYYLTFMWLSRWPTLPLNVIIIIIIFIIRAPQGVIEPAEGSLGELCICSLSFFVAEARVY